MSASPTACPGIAEIERLASGQPVDESIALHVASCSTCTERLEFAKDDAAFLGKVRVLAGRDLAPQGAPRLPGYRTIGVVSSGGQGVIYRAVQESTSRTVAIKTLMEGRLASPRQRVRAEREAEIAARLRHPNIVTVFESRTLSDGRIAVVMEFVNGVPLDTWKPSALTPQARQRELLQTFVGVCNGVHHAHLNGVIHRDLKPDNILVTPEGRAVVVDFGIAKAGGIPSTLTGEFAGTPQYASPEQVSGHPDDVDALTDVYSLGVILYRLLCRRMPYDLDGTIFDMARTISQVEPPHPRVHDPSIHPDLGSIILRALRKEKNRRYQSAASFGRDIERFLADQPVEARSGSGWYLLRKAVAVNRGRLAWVAAASVLAVSAVAAIGWSLASAAASERQAAMQEEIARGESIRARAVTEFLREALPRENPERPEIRNVIGAGLNHLYLRLETRSFAGDPDLDQALRRLWGSVYSGFGGNRAAGLVEYAEVSLRNGLMRLKLLHGEKHPEIAATLHELAGVLMVRSRFSEAESACNAALEMRRSLLGPSSAATISSQSLLARIYLAAGDNTQAARAADEVLAAASSLPEVDADLLAASMLSLKARVLLARQDATSAAPLVKDSLEKRMRRLPIDDTEMLASLADAADVIERGAGAASLTPLFSGIWKQDSAPALAAAIRDDAAILSRTDLDYIHVGTVGRTQALGRAAELQSALLGPGDPAVVPTLMAQSKAAAAEHFPDIREFSAAKAADILAKRFGEHDISVLLGAQEAGSIAVSEGYPDRAITYFTRVCEIWDSIPLAARDMCLAGNARRLLAFSYAVAERNSEALAQYAVATTQCTKAFGERSHIVALTQAMHAITLLETGKPDEAEALSASALRLAQELSRSVSRDQFAHIRFARGYVLARQGKSDDAAPLLQASWDGFYRLLGPRFRWRRLLVTMMADHARQHQDDAGAAAWLSQLDLVVYDEPVPRIQGNESPRIR